MANGKLAAAEYTYITRTGNEHQSNQDAFFCAENGSMRFYGLADGRSGNACSGLGGKTALEAVWRQLRTRQSILELQNTRYPDELCYELLHAVRSELRALAEQHHQEVSSLASTLMIFLADRTGAYATIHLGDGLILALKNGGRKIISRPENGITAQYTVFTTTPDALLHVRVEYGFAEEQYDRILLMTDGAYPLSLEPLLNRASPEQIRQRLENLDPPDDASCLLLELKSS